jgi:hypothetical protein
MYRVTPKTSAAHGHTTSLQALLPGVFKRMGVLAPGERFKLEPREVRQLLLWAPKGDWRRGRQEMEAELARFGCTFKYDGGYVIEKRRTTVGM